MSDATPRRRLALLTWSVIGALGALHGALLLINLRRVPSTFGYDWPGHFSYLFYLDRFGRTPPAELSAQFFNPPFYYAAVSLTHRLTGSGLLDAWKLLNALLALLAFALLVLLCRLAWGDRPLPTAWWLAVYVLNPTVYRTFAMLRPEALLLPLFLLAALLVFLRSRGWLSAPAFGVLSGLLAGFGMGVRQWAIFLEAALLLWLLIELLPALRAATGAARRALVTPAVMQIVLFCGVTLLAYLLRGAALTSFNAPLNPSGAAFLFDLRLPVLFSTPIRPALNDRFWPILYADLWGDYWRYWIEALGRDVLPSAAGTIALLRRMMLAALPLSLLALVGLIVRRLPDAAAQRWQRYNQLLIGVTLAGFALFALLFAGGDKGDTVKSVYVVYLVPVIGWFAALGSVRLRRLWPRALWIQSLLLLAAGGLLLPGLFYTAPTRESQRVYSAPPFDAAAGVAFGDAYELTGYSIARPAADRLELTLIWHAQGYTGLDYKVFVHALDDEGQIVAQADGVPAGWTRPTIGWAPGEYIIDVHMLSAADLESVVALRVGLYDALTGTRLTTAANQDGLMLPPAPTR